MSRPRLPERTEEGWKAGFVLDPPQPLSDVSGAGGLVIAGGDAIFMLRPGAEQWKMRARPDGVEAVAAVAAEQGPPFRYAVSSASAGSRSSICRKVRC